MSWILDVFIFCGGIWEIVVAIDISDEDAAKTIYIVGSLIIIFTFLRVLNILVMVLYVVFVGPIYCLPDWCPCRKYLDMESVDPNVITNLTLN